MKVLLDENFPLGLVRVLEADGLKVDHIITLGWRGAADARIRQRLTDRDLVFLTQDDDFLSGPEVFGAWQQSASDVRIRAESVGSEQIFVRSSPGLD